MPLNKADVIVVGGGIIGVASAYYAALSGADVILVERRQIGTGSSSGNAGFVMPNSLEPLPGKGAIRKNLHQLLDSEGFFGIRFHPDPALMIWLARFATFCTQKHADHVRDVFSGLSKEALRLHLDLAKVAGNTYQFDQRGVITLFLRHHHLETVWHNRQKTAKGRVKRLSTDAVCGLEPIISEKIAGGLHSTDDAFLSPALFVEWLAKQAVSLGACILPETEVYGFNHHRGRISALLTTRGVFTTGQVVLAGGAWLRQLGRMLRVNLPVEGGKGLSLSYFRPQRQVRYPLLLYEHHVAVSPLSDYLRLTGLMELSGLDTTISPKRIRGLRRSVGHYLPNLSKRLPDRVWSGLRPCVPDGLPLLGRLKSYPNVVVAGGHDTKGISLGPLTGQYVAKLLGGASLGNLEEKLRPDRFCT